MAIEFNVDKVQVVDLNSVHPNSWNPKDKDTKELDSIVQGIKLKGQRMPIVVREDGNGFEILDGEQRWTACQKLGFEKVLIYNEGIVSDKEAKELTIWYQQQVPFNQTELAYLVTEMASQYQDLELPYTDVEMDEFKKLAEFNFEDYDTTGDESYENEGDPKTVKIVVTDSQYKVIRKALDEVVAHDECTEGQALERICADFLAGSENTTDDTEDEPFV